MQKGWSTMQIVESVKKYLKDYKVENKIICAISGGCDSVVMTHILSKLGLEVVAIHLNHNWRGEESLRDENFSREFAKSLGIEFYSEKLSFDVKKTETDAREARYLFFKSCAKKFNSKYVFLAHNKNDNAETLLYRVIKGTGLKGLCSIPKHRDIFYRPLLDITREEIEAYAKENNLKYVNDSSNDSIKYKRNFIRKEILPLVKKINPDVICALNNLSQVANMQYEIVSNGLNKAKEDIFFNDKIILEKYLSLSEPLKYEIINDFIGVDLKYRDFKRIKSYVDFIEKNKTSASKKSICKNLFLEISNGFIFKSHLQDKNMLEIQISQEGEYAFGDKTVVIKKLNSMPDFKNLKNILCANLDFKKPITLRTRRKGDIFSPFGIKQGKMKLKDYLINKKILRQTRDNLLLLTHDSEVLCILGVQISQKVAVNNNSNCYEIKITE